MERSQRMKRDGKLPLEGTYDGDTHPHRCPECGREWEHFVPHLWKRDCAPGGDAPCMWCAFDA